MLVLTVAHIVLNRRNSPSREHGSSLARFLALVSCYNHFVKLFYLCFKLNVYLINI
jgi:hypothetical protein